MTVLSNPKYYEYAGWDLLWFKTREKCPLDERIYLIANYWLYANCDSKSELSNLRNILIETLRYWRTVRSSDDTKFAEFIIEIMEDGSFFSDQLRIPFSSLIAGLDVISLSLSHGDYIFALLLALANNYYPYDELEKLLLDLERGTFDGSDIYREVVNSHYLLMERILEKVTIFEGEDAVVAFNKRWRSNVVAKRKSEREKIKNPF
jgi:hypothetical protein